MARPTDHPARYTPALIDVIGRALGPRLLIDEGNDWRPTIIDPFAGTGERLALIAEAAGARPVGVEITAAFIEHPCVIAGDATRLPFASASFDGGCSSPTYGNGINDSFRSSASDTSAMASSSWPMYGVENT